MVPVPVVSVALEAIVKVEALISGLLVAPVAPAFVPSPMVRAVETDRVSDELGHIVWAVVPFGFNPKFV